MRRISRRSFLKVALAAVAAGLGSFLEACGKGGAARKRATEAPATSPSTRPTLTLAPTSPAENAGRSTSPAENAGRSTSQPAPPKTRDAVAVLPSELAADTILVNGKVRTIDASDSIAQAVAVKDGLVQAVGSDAEVRALTGAKTQVIDLAGRCVTPGLIDPHNHLQVWGSTQSWYVPFLPPDVKTNDDLRRALSEVLAQKAEGEWVEGYYWIVDGRLPNRHDLDPVSPKHPVWLLQQGGHYGSANSVALRLAGITSSTPDPVGGVIERDASGEPTGVFYNHRAMDILRRVAPAPTPEMVYGFVVEGQPVFAAEGVTTFHDNNVRGVDNVKAYFDADRNSQMLIRGRVYYTLEWPSDLDRALKEVEYYRGHGYMDFGGFKFLLDGQFQMAYCHEPHNGVRWDVPTWEPQSFKDAVRALHDTGLQVCVHCAGDAAVDLTLDAYEEAMNANPRPDPRHRIEHCVISTPQATQRIKDLGVVVSTQPQFVRMGGNLIPNIVGEGRAARAMVTREWLDAGVALALGSDAPTTPWILPQVTLAGAVTRIGLDDARFHPEQSLTAQEALRAHTMGAAYAGFEEHTKGSIEPGKLADLVVWSRDPVASFEPFEGSGPLDADALLRAIGLLKAQITMVGGKVIHQA